MKMKKLKKFASLLAAVALCVLLPGKNMMTASADAPVTYYIMHINDDQGWRFQTGGFSETGTNRDLYYMYEEIKDGDLVVVDNNGSEEFLELNFSTRLSNLTIVRDSHAVVAAPSIDVVYALAGSSSAITGDVTDAYTYDDAGVTFHSNVGTITMYDTENESAGTVTVAGTAGHMIRQTQAGYVYFDIYNVAQNKLVVEGGSLKTEEAYYSHTPVEQAAQTPAATATPAATQQTTAASNEYDEVPKTGDSSIVLWLTGTAVLCLMGRRALKRS